MKIELEEISVRKLVKGYHDDGEGGVVGCEGKLNIRPPYQREFVYSKEQREAVVNTVMEGLPLNTMYWSVRKDGGYEIIDGQQRTVSIAQYVHNYFSFKGRMFHSLQDDEQEKILDYELMVYLCRGTNSERLAWFKIINIAGEELSDQEIRNAVYAGPWVSAAKKDFSRTGCPAYDKAGDYLKGRAIRQHYLETAINWARGEDSIDEFMTKHQYCENADPLWNYFEKVIDWVEVVFPVRRKEMKGLDWGEYYRKYSMRFIESMEKDVARLMADGEVTKKSGIYPYLLSGNEQNLKLRVFEEHVKRTVYERQGGMCNICGKEVSFEKMEGDHIDPWSDGGKTVPENCQMLCRPCNRRKSSK